MEQPNLSDRRNFLKKTIQGAGLAFAAPTILSSLGSSKLFAQASGAGGSTIGGRPYGNNDGKALP